MPTVTRPVAAALGLVPAVIDKARQLPTTAAQLPMRVLTTALTGVAGARREYDELAKRGERLVRRIRRTSFDELEDRVEDVVARTPAARAYDRVEDALEDAADSVRGSARRLTRVDSAATSEVVEVVEQVSSVVDAEPVLQHDDLPLADYDHMTLGSLRSRLRTLTLEQLVQLRDYEKSKGDRLPVITMFDNRIAKLATGEAKPSGGSTTAPAQPR
jgi:hypothetical protein